MFTMVQSLYPITELRNIAGNIFLLTFRAPEIAAAVKPGQFVNVKVHESDFPLLRRPFSVYHTWGEEVSVLFNAVGAGTKILSGRRKSEMLDVIGPLGNSFSPDGDFQTALLVAGGMGVASLPLLTAALMKSVKSVVTFLGARTATQLLESHLENLHISTDDGSRGYRGTVIGLLRNYIEEEKLEKPKIFACGPPAMLKLLSEVADSSGIVCEVSVESVMACGVGLCQGCPIERVNGKSAYALVCNDGPVFDSRTIHLVLHD